MLGMFFYVKRYLYQGSCHLVNIQGQVPMSRYQCPRPDVLVNIQYQVTRSMHRDRYQCPGSGIRARNQYPGSRNLVNGQGQLQVSRVKY